MVEEVPAAVAECLMKIELLIENMQHVWRVYILFEIQRILNG